MKERIIFLALIAGLLVALAISYTRSERLIQERDRYRGDAEALLGDVATFRVRDSLSAARVQALELTVREFERFRAEDAALIRELQGRNRDLVSVNEAQAKTIIDLRAMPRDTVIVRDSIPIRAIALHCGDRWYDFDGLLADGEFSGRLENRDSLLLAETVRYKRFLGFLWKTGKVKDRRLDAVSRNPHTKIEGLEYVFIEK